MKKTTWALIIGMLVFIVSVFGIVGVIDEPNDLLIINISGILQNLLWMVFGIFLIITYVKYHKKQDQNLLNNSITPDSPEDKENLRVSRSRILGYILIIAFIPSLEYWLLADYSAGLNIINISTIFDLLVNLIFAYIIIQLFRGKDVIKLLLYTVIVYGVGGLLFGILQQDFSLAVTQILMSGYFVFVILMPLNRKNHRLAYFVILPIVLVLMFIAVEIDQLKLNKLLRDEAKIEQEFLNLTDDVNTTYLSILEKDYVARGDLDDILNGLDKREVKRQEVISKVEEIKDELNRQHRLADQIYSIKTWDIYLESLDIHRQQGEKLRGLVQYYKTIDSNNISNEQRIKIDDFSREIDSYNIQLRDKETELDDLN
jgi:hypothetical protein